MISRELPGLLSGFAIAMTGTLGWAILTLATVAQVESVGYVYSGTIVPPNVAPVLVGELCGWQKKFVDTSITVFILQVNYLGLIRTTLDNFSQNRDNNEVMSFELISEI